jgi:acyl transferase domain-containing protein
MAAPAAKFAAFMGTVPVGVPTIPFVSNVTGSWIAEEDIRSPRYWGAQLREPVQLERGLASVLSRAGGPLVEVGPGRGMLSLAQAQPARRVRTLTSAGGGADLEMLYEALAALWESGTELSWPALAREGRRASLPTYSFQRRRYWTDPAADGPAQPARGAAPPGAGREVAASGPACPGTHADGGGPPAAAGDRKEPGIPLEAELNGVFRRVLGAEQIGCTDNFFALGGNSLLALDLIAQVRRDYQVKIPLRDFFSMPTVQGLASLVGTTRPHEEAAPSGEHARD